MAPPTGPLNLDVEAISGICGSISIAAWVVVFSPQIIENFRRGSADGLSLHFLIIWLLGDVFNVLGSVLQRVLPTMIILAVYYTIADIVLLGQVFSYRGFTLKEKVIPPQPKPTVIRTTSVPNETTTLLNNSGNPFEQRERRGSDWSNLSPAVPMLSEQPITPPAKPTKLKAILWNATAIAMVCAAGVAGWLLSRHHGEDKPHGPSEDELHFDFWGQVFGWLCAALYLGSRVPQLLLNWRRKSTEGVSILFFLFACLGNLTYVLSIMAYNPRCAHRHCRPGETRDLYSRYILVNASWLAGSFGTLLLDMGVFVQFFIYGDDNASSVGDDEETLLEDEESNIDETRWDQRPLLERGDSDAH
ncbi:solute carrier family 66 (lysosomal lysine-arginine transporter) member 1 [Microdochium nivale]|nr:solute carrier family 66 (lysosomal lysine-arginine transporter) member 1 [Microdochium nivale]